MAESQDTDGSEGESAQHQLGDGLRAVFADGAEDAEKL